MFLGHLAIGFAAKRAAPRAGLAPLMAAPVLLDLVWPAFVLLGLEEVRIEPGATAVTPLDFASYPWSHSLAFAALWAVLFGGGYLARTRYRAGAVVIAAGVLSHWALDLVVHRPDLPLWPGSARFGLGLWNSVPTTVAVEVALFAAGVLLYASATRTRDRTGTVALWGFVAFVAGIYAANLLGPPPPSARAVAWAGLAQWLWVPWAALIDRHRALRDGAPFGALAS
ncbi:MAG: metal-dependent hydrolase [Anaeromyxobacteraceae bacterium]